MTPSPIRNVIDLLWSAITLKEISAGLKPCPTYLFSKSLSVKVIIGLKRSESKLLLTFCATAESLSSPIPVSMLGFGSGASFPSASLLYCMNTRFHTSINLSQSHSTLHSGLPHPIPSPWSMCISEQGPHGPVSPILKSHFLEIISERKITEHLKKCVVPRSSSHHLKVVMLSPCTDTLL